MTVLAMSADMRFPRAIFLVLLSPRLHDSASRRQVPQPVAYFP